MTNICPPGCIPIKSKNKSKSSKNIKSNKSSKCPKDKIINPKTNRCVSKTGVVGKSLLKTKKVNVIKCNSKDPLDSKYHNLVDKGLVSKDVNLVLKELNNKIGEISDVYSVSKGKKQLAALDFSAYGRKKLKKLNLKLINKVIDYCNCMGVQMLHNTKTGGAYLKTIFFLPHNYDKALKLMNILWYPHSNIPNNMFDVSIGLLLGYDIDNIIYISKRGKLNITKKDILSIQKKIDKMKITLEDLQGKYKIVHKTVIPNL